MQDFHNPLAAVTAIHWVAVLLYVGATFFNTVGIVFGKKRPERLGYRLLAAGLAVHTAGILYRWEVAGHGPYMTRYEVLSSDAWVILVLFLVLARIYPRIRPASVAIFPSAFLMVALGLFLNPEVKKLPPTLRSIWLVLHIGFYKVALATVLVAVALSLFLILKRRGVGGWLKSLPEPEALDIYAYRFAGFGFVFWGIGMVAGSIWAYQSWGRFWAWDPIETWSLLCWGAFGVYLHLRRFFRWRGERAAWFLLACFALMIFAVFFTSLLEQSIHSEYFK